MPKLSLRRTAIALATLASLYGGIAFADDLNPAAAPSADASANNPHDKAKTMEAVSVVASGETRQVQKVTSEDLQQLAPGTSPLKAIDKLPGVNFQAADPWGDYEWSTQITLHGFDQSRLGFTLDNIPLGNMSYGTTTGLQVTRAISSDNISTVELAQGAGALGTASNTNLGGTIQFYSADPDTVAGARINQVIGSDSTTRTFVRLDTGDYHGFSMYVSYDHASTDKWKGYGDQRSDQVNLKSVYQWDSGSVSLFYDSSRRKEYDYMDLSLASQKALGWNWDYLQPDWNTAVQIANAYNGKGAYPAVLSSLPAGYDLADSSYYAGGGIRHDNLAGLSGTFNLNDHTTLNLGTYYHDNRGEGQWATPYVASSPAVPLAMRTTDYGLDRYGGTGSLTYTIANNDIEVGFWAENAKTNQERNYFYLTGAYDYLSNFYENEEPFLRGFFQRYNTQTRMAYASDTIHLLDDRLTLNVGAKALGVTNTADSLVASSALAAGRIRASDGFLPQAGVNYKIDANQEVYASYSKNLSAYGFLPFSQSQEAFDASKSSLKPEQSQTFELGYRVHGDTIEASADAYYTRFTNRLLAVSPCSAVQTCSTSASVIWSVSGSARTRALMPSATGVGMVTALRWKWGCSPRCGLK